MKTIRCIIYAVAMLLCISCKTNEFVSCEEITNTNDAPWLSSITKTGITQAGQKLVSIDKITYVNDSLYTIYIGFDVLYEKLGYDIPYEYIYNCEGKIITSYGGIAGCNGECDLQISSRLNIYTAE